MSTSTTRLSVPPPRTTLPRPLTDEERGTLVALADALCGPSDRAEPPSRCPEFTEKLDIALATRSDSFDQVVAAVAATAGADDLFAWLRDLHASDADAFQVLSAVLGGAYLMVPSVREAIGYGGQRREIARPEEAIDEIMDGILEPVLQRGHFYVSPPEED
ncbi:hypothetical protein ACIBL3_41375 [Kribbella sp. NPDC050124]|uniref:hypothetical protein n=1 Tax=Kribbella sp. NPDC050124 TaxID=3364114 RepID=UPI00378A694A